MAQSGGREGEEGVGRGERKGTGEGGREEVGREGNEGGPPSLCGPGAEKRECWKGRSPIPGPAAHPWRGGEGRGWDGIGGATRGREKYWREILVSHLQVKWKGSRPETQVGKFANLDTKNASACSMCLWERRESRRR